jgi:transglutaminase-like putative cysteine protease
VRLQIEHITTYEYARPVSFERHRLVLRPREEHDLRVQQMQLQITPAHHLHWVLDVFGNSVALVDFIQPAAMLHIVNNVVVERTAPFPSCHLHDPWRVAYPPQYDPMEAAITGVYATPSYMEDTAPLRTWLKTALTTDTNDAEGTMLALCRLIHGAIAYQRRSEKGVQTPAQTLERKTGSCRDMATLMMDAARLCGVAARFVSGYLHGTASLAGHASTHAWTEVYLPMLGWRGFDPVIGTLVTFNHIVTGVSSHPRGVMPVSGTFVGAKTDYQGLQVSVKTTVL